jgi:RHS repeat-associated protein
MFKELHMARHTALTLAILGAMGTGSSPLHAHGSAALTVSPPLSAPTGVTALSGQILAVDGTPLPNVLLTDGPMASTRTDGQGRFLLSYVPVGKSVVRVDGRHAGAAKSADYGTYEIQVTAEPHHTTELPFTSWLTLIDHANDIVLASPTSSEVVVRTPRIPGLELHIPAGTILTDWDGKRINRISLTPVRADRPPFPLPRETMFKDYFTAQPGGTTMWSASGARAAARIIYPNHGTGLPGARTEFWHYHPQAVGWLPYGGATVSQDGKSVVPDAGATIYDFMGGGAVTDVPDVGVKDPTNSAAGSTNGSSDGDPVDLGSGIFTRNMTDLTISDVIPISVTRTYVSSDSNYHDFGLGISLSYEMFPALSGGSQQTAASEAYSQFNMYVPGSRVPFVNTTPAYGNYSDALFVAQNFPGPFLNAQARWTGNGFTVTRTDGKTYAFGYHSTLTYMQDRFGNRVTLTYQQVVAPGANSPSGANNRLVKISSPNGRSFQFTWEDLFPGGTNSPTKSDIYVIQSVVDDLGRQTNYSYDSCGRLTTIQDASAIVNGTTKTTKLAWMTAATSPCVPPTGSSTTAPLNLLASITDQVGNLIVQNTYEYQNQPTSYCESGASSGTITTGRVCGQTLGAPGTSSTPTYAYTYTVDANDNILTTTVQDPRTNKRTVNFVNPANVAHSPGYPSSETLASNSSSISQTWTYQRDPITSTLTEVIAPPLVEESETTGRVTAFCYDNTAPNSPNPIYRPWNLTSVVRNLTSSGVQCPMSVQTGSTTQNATTLFTYSPVYNQLTSITDPNNNTTTFCRGQATATGCTVSTSNPFEEATSIIDANGNVANVTYAPDGQVSSTSRVASASQTLQNNFTYDHDDLVALTVVGGSGTASQVWSTITDAVGRPIQKIDPLGDTRTIIWDPIFGPVKVVDQNGTFESFLYLQNGTILKALQPKGNTAYTYNGANLPATATDPLGNVASYYYDLDNNLNCTIDRRGNQANFVYDDLNRINTATYYIGNTTGCTGTPGTTDSTVAYSFDHGNRLLSVTDSVGGTVTRGWDDLDRLSSDAQAPAGSGASIGTVSYGYDLGNRLTGMTPSSGTPETFAYDPANRLLAIQGTTGGQISVCFTYDQADRRTGLVLPNGVTGNYSYDTVSDLLQIAYLTGGSYASGTCTLGTGSGAGSGTLTYAYDQNGRQVARGNGTTGANAYYTAVNPSPFAATSVAYNDDNQQTSWNSLSNIFDGNGNLTCTGSTSTTICQGAQSQAFTWDARNRMVSAAAAPGLGGSAETYVYDGLSRRQSVSVAAQTTASSFLYFGLNPVAITATNTGTGSVTDSQTIFSGLGLDERYHFFDSATGTLDSNIIDIQGSTLALLQGGRNAVSYSYPPFGSNSTPSATYPNPFRYTGREASDNTGLYYYRGRYYSPAFSRFVSEDPLGLAAGANIYAYVGNDPIDGIDPTGRGTIYTTGDVGGSAGTVGYHAGGSAFITNDNGGVPDFGVASSNGPSNGLGYGTSVVLGYMSGPLSNFSGNSFFNSASFGPVVLGVTFNNNSLSSANGGFIGFGLGSDYGFEGGASNTVIGLSASQVFQGVVDNFFSSYDFGTLIGGMEAQGHHSCPN